MSRFPALLSILGLFLQGGAISESPNSTKIPAPAPATPGGPPHPGLTIYQRACMSCHQADGRGQAGLFPPLRDADWIKAPDPARLIRITLHGMVGPVSINGIPFQSSAPFMPGHAATLSDPEIATVLTWIRKEMGGLDAPVTAAAVTSIRQAEAGRTALWTQAQLLAIPLTVPPATPP